MKESNASLTVTLPLEVFRDNSDGQSVRSASKQKRARRRYSFDPESALPRVESERPLEPSRNPPESTLSDFIPFITLWRWIGQKVFVGGTEVNPEMNNTKGQTRRKGIESNVPLEIILALSK